MARFDRLGVLALAAAGILAAAPARPAAVITVVNNDGPGEGFNDATAATPVGGNTGTTVGQQRLIVFERAAAIWGAQLDSPVEIKIRATFDPLSCDANTATLGQTRPNTVVADSPGVPLAGVWYPAALGSRFAGSDVDPTGEDMVAQFNSNLGQAGCLDGVGWYYGLDDNHGDQIDLVTVLLHEFAHGLGFLSLVDESTGAEFLNTPDIFESFILDTESNKHWIDMTPAERAVSAINTGNLAWDGANGVSLAPEYLGPSPVLTVDSPTSLAGDRRVGTATFGPPVSEEAVSGVLVQAADPNDVAGPSTTDACSALTNAAPMAGHVAIVDRGTCTFVSKAANVQAAGAIAMVVVDNVPSSAPAGMSGDDASVTIPSVRLTKADGDLLKENLAAGIVVSLRINPRSLAGTGAGKRPLLYAPDPDEPGSSISHWDTSVTPNLLMEPNINGDLGHDVDLTLPVLRDLGWTSDAVPPPAPRSAPAQTPADHSTRALAERP